jgi:hypothetical protein
MAHDEKLTTDNFHKSLQLKVNGRFSNDGPRSWRTCCRGPSNDAFEAALAGCLNIFAVVDVAVLESNGGIVDYGVDSLARSQIRIEASLTNAR